MGGGSKARIAWVNSEKKYSNSTFQRRGEVDREFGRTGKRMKNDLAESGFKDFIIGRAKSQHEMDTQIDRMGGEFRKNESSGEIRELGREDYRDAEELAELSQWVKTL